MTGQPIQKYGHLLNTSSVVISMANERKEHECIEERNE